jgi:hypothetical protein
MELLEKIQLSNRDFFEIFTAPMTNVMGFHVVKRTVFMYGKKKT